MKKLILSSILFLLMLPGLHAAEQPYQNGNFQDIKKPTDELLNHDLKLAVQRIQELEQQVKGMNSTNRSLEERIRVLERNYELLRTSKR